MPFPAQAAPSVCREAAPGNGLVDLPHAARERGNERVRNVQMGVGIKFLQPKAGGNEFVRSGFEDSSGRLVEIVALVFRLLAVEDFCLSGLLFFAGEDEDFLRLGKVNACNGGW